jgi:hypothetical protein
MRSPLHLVLVVVMALITAPLPAVDLPDCAKDVVTAYDTKCYDLKAKGAAALAKETEDLVKVLQRAFDRETKAKHDDVASLVKSYLDGLPGARTAANGKGDGKSAAPTGTNPPWEEFLKKLKVSSGGYYSNKKAEIAFDGYSMKCKNGLNVMALANGKRVIERVYLEMPDFQKLVNDIAALPQGAYVVMAMQDHVNAGEWVRDAPKAFTAVGGKEGVAEGTRQWSYLLVGAKGIPKGKAFEKNDHDELLQFPPPPKK